MGANNGFLVTGNPIENPKVGDLFSGHFLFFFSSKMKGHPPVFFCYSEAFFD